MPRTLTAICLLLLATPLLASAEPSAKPKGGTDAALSTLTTRLDVVDFQDVAPEFVFDWLRELGAANVTVNWAALEVEGVSRTDPLIQVQMHQATVAEVLNEILPQLSDSHAVGYRGSGNLIRISTKADFNRRLYVRVYDVTDLVLPAPRFTDAPQIDVAELRSPSTSGGEAVISPFTSGPSGDDDPAEGDDLERTKALRSLIEASIAPESWEPAGGRGTIQLFNNTLVVRASIEVHEEIGGLFQFSP